MYYLMSQNFITGFYSSRKIFETQCELLTVGADLLNLFFNGVKNVQLEKIRELFQSIEFMEETLGY